MVGVLGEQALWSQMCRPFCPSISDLCVQEKDGYLTLDARHLSQHGLKKSIDRQEESCEDSF